ncbi:MAG: hypothetical protein OEW67_05005 [Cyclobacteriaceae bacterium]|nr:hypothetical protein [Cyclobacteriaceae bacterium]
MVKENNDIKIKETLYADMHIKNGILHCYFKKRDRIDINIAKEGVKDRIEFIKKKDYPCLFDISKVNEVSKEARDYLANEGNDYVLASALVVNSPVIRVLANFFIIVNKPKNPTKMFNDRKKAVKWLNTFRK